MCKRFQKYHYKQWTFVWISTKKGVWRKNYFKVIYCYLILRWKRQLASCFQVAHFGVMLLIQHIKIDALRFMRFHKFYYLFVLFHLSCIHFLWLLHFVFKIFRTLISSNRIEIVLGKCLSLWFLRNCTLRQHLTPWPIFFCRKLYRRLKQLQNVYVKDDQHVQSTELGRFRVSDIMPNLFGW